MCKNDGIDPDESYARDISGFYLDRFEVTVGRFSAFLRDYMLPREGTGAHPKIPGSGWQESWEELLNLDYESELAVPPSPILAERQISDPAYCMGSATWTAEDQTLPINCVSWYLAFAFCVFDGGRLPTEAEWNYVSAHGADHRPYPWSDSPSDLAITDAEATFTSSFDNPLQLPTPVGSHSSGRGGFFRNSGQGHDDLAGNVAEWTLDEWTDPPAATCSRDCMAAWQVDGGDRVLRGGSFAVPSSRLRSGSRSSSPAYNISSLIGFRCARDSISNEADSQ